MLMEFRRCVAASECGGRTSAKICALNFKICPTYFKICLTYFSPHEKQLSRLCLGFVQNVKPAGKILTVLAETSNSRRAKFSELCVY